MRLRFFVWTLWIDGGWYKQGRWPWESKPVELSPTHANGVYAKAIDKAIYSYQANHPFDRASFGESETPQDEGFA